MYGHVPSGRAEQVGGCHVRQRGGLGGLPLAGRPAAGQQVGQQAGGEQDVGHKGGIRGSEWAQEWAGLL